MEIDFPLLGYSRPNLSITTLPIGQLDYLLELIAFLHVFAFLQAACELHILPCKWTDAINSLNQKVFNPCSYIHNAICMLLEGVPNKVLNTGTRYRPNSTPRALPDWFDTVDPTAATKCHNLCVTWVVKLHSPTNIQTYSEYTSVNFLPPAKLQLNPGPLE